MVVMEGGLYSDLAIDKEYTTGMYCSGQVDLVYDKCLKNIKSDIIADFICLTNNRLIITMNKLANTFDLDMIKKYIKNIQNINLDSIDCLCLPKSKLYLKIIGLPHVME